MMKITPPESRTCGKGSAKYSIAAIATLLLLCAGAPAVAQKMEITSPDARPSLSGPATYFTGKAVVTPLYGTNDSTSSTGGLVKFEPGARSAWHTHPAGQILIITEGTGWVQEEGQKKRLVKQGDVIWTPPGVKHWHGAAADHDMSHIAITNMVGGKNVDWMEQVSDAQYRN